ncbi:F-box/WD repeat-containing protein lin-23 [Cercospora zeina]
MDRSTSYNMSRSPIQLDEGFSEDTHSQHGSDSMDDSNGLAIGTDAHFEHVSALALTLTSGQKYDLIQLIAGSLSTTDLLLVHKSIGALVYFDPVQHLPNELIYLIFSHLSPRDLLAASAVSRPWRDRTQDEGLWQDNFYREGWALERSKLNEPEQLAQRRGTEHVQHKLRTTQPGTLLSRHGSRKRARNEAFSEDETQRAQQEGASASKATATSDPDVHNSMEGVEATGEVESANSAGSQASTSTDATSIDSRLEHGRADESDTCGISSEVVLSPSVFTKATPPKISWPWLYKQRRRLESNWDAGKYATFRLPHPDHEYEGHKECVYTIQHSGNDLVSGSRDKTIRCWNLNTQRLRIPELKGHEASVLCLQFDARTDEKHDIIVSGGSDNFVIVWRFSTGQILRKMTSPHTESVLNLRFDDRYLITCSKDKTIRIWNRHEITNTDPIIPARVLPQFAEGPAYLSPFTLLDTLYGHQAAVNAVQINDSIIVSASGDRTIKSWDIHSMKEGPSHRKSYTGHTKGIACVQFDGRRIVSGSSDNSVRIFDYDTTAEVACLDGHNNLVRTVQARFGDMDTVTSEELAEEAREADRKFLKALDEGKQPIEPSRVRRQRNAGSSRPSDMLSYGTKIPPGGGGSRWSKIVSGSYDETIIIWKRDPNKAGKWRPNVRLHQGSMTIGSGNNRVRVNVGVTVNGAPLNMANPAAQGIQPAQAANAAHQAHMILQQAHTNLALANAALSDPAVTNASVLPQSQMTAVAAAQANLNQQLQIVANQQSAEGRASASQVPTATSHAEPAQVAPTTNAAPAANAQQTHVGTNAPGPAHNGTAAPAGPATVNGAAQQVPAPAAAPQHHHHHGHHHHHHGHGHRSESNRVFKLQFDARRIIACSQNKVIVGWDFANGDKDLEWIGDWSRETN